MVLASALLHAVWNGYAKRAGNPTAFLGLLAITSTAVSIAALPFFDLAEIPRSVWWLTGGTAVAHVFYQVFLGVAYERGDLSVVYPIARSTPALVAIIAVPLLGDPVTVGGAAGIAVVVAGMWLVQTDGRITIAALTGPGVGFAYLTLITTAGYSILDKQAMVAFANAERWSGPLPVSLTFFVLLQIASGIPYIPYALSRAPRSHVLLILRQHKTLLAVGTVAAIASYGLILAALQTASVSYVTAVRQTSVLFATAIGVAFLRERPGRARIAGAVAIVAGVASMVIA